MSDAHEAIRNLLGSYCELMDAGDIEALSALFEHGQLSDDAGNVFCTGSEQMAAMWHKQTILYNGSPRTRHITANPIIEVDETAGTARVRSSYIVFQGIDGPGDGELTIKPIITGRYLDRFARSAEGTWHWRERSYGVDQLGDLSHHLLH
jgi:hypothetical protein